MLIIFQTEDLNDQKFPYLKHVLTLFSSAPKIHLYIHCLDLQFCGNVLLTQEMQLIFRNFLVKE